MSSSNRDLVFLLPHLLPTLCSLLPSLSPLNPLAWEDNAFKRLVFFFWKHKIIPYFVDLVYSMNTKNSWIGLSEAEGFFDSQDHLNYDRCDNVNNSWYFCCIPSVWGSCRETLVLLPSPGAFQNQLHSGPGCQRQHPSREGKESCIYTPTRRLCNWDSLTPCYRMLLSLWLYRYGKVALGTVSFQTISQIL